MSTKCLCLRCGVFVWWFCIMSYLKLTPVKFSFTFGLYFLNDGSGGFTLSVWRQIKKRTQHKTLYPKTHFFLSFLFKLLGTIRFVQSINRNKDTESTEEIMWKIGVLKDDKSRFLFYLSLAISYILYVLGYYIITAFDRHEKCWN